MSLKGKVAVIYGARGAIGARIAARRMVANQSGVIMTVTALHSRTGIPSGWRVLSVPWPLVVVGYPGSTLDGPSRTNPCESHAAFFSLS